jgi:hypothetical protein
MPLYHGLQDIKLSSHYQPDPTINLHFQTKYSKVANTSNKPYLLFIEQWKQILSLYL